MLEIIDLKFKDMPPEETVKKIQSILTSLGIEVEEKWNESGVEHCHSLSVTHKNGYASSNGKGITKELARASAYAEFIERLQQGLHYYKLPALAGNPGLNLQAYTPDGKCMTLQELEECSDWMDYLIQAYGSKITRKQITKLCRAYACTEDDKILTIPYYSIFEDKYVYIPADFATQMYTSNGCCAGNTPEEAFVHAISEIFERNCKDRLLLSGFSAPKLSDNLLRQFSTVWKIVSDLRTSGDFDVSIFDISYETGFPVVATRIIDKRTHNYIVNAAADPVLEIAIQRTLTETFQGRSITAIRAGHNGAIVNTIFDISLTPNIRNMRESSNGIYSSDFFCDADDNYTTMQYADNRTKNNQELLSYVLDLCRKLNKPVYIRNYSYLGFTSYKVIIPGFSEGFWPHLLESTPEYALGNETAKTLRNICGASKIDITLMLLYTKKVSAYTGVVNNFSRLSGIPLRGKINSFLSSITLAHAYYVLGKSVEAQQYCATALLAEGIDESTKEYLSCVLNYLTLKNNNIPEDKLDIIISKFNKYEYATKLQKLLNDNLSPFSDYLLQCNFDQCEKCRYQDYCTYKVDSNTVRKVGQLYSEFTDGQNKENFPTV